MASAYVNILWKWNEWWGLLGSHLEISSRNSLASSLLSASQTEMPFSAPNFLLQQFSLLSVYISSQIVHDN